MEMSLSPLIIGRKATASHLSQIADHEAKLIGAISQRHAAMLALQIPAKIPSSLSWGRHGDSIVVWYAVARRMENNVPPENATGSSLACVPMERDVTQLLPLAIC